MNTDPQGHWDYQVKVERVTLVSLDERLKRVEEYIAGLQNDEPEQLELPS